MIGFWTFTGILALIFTVITVILVRKFYWDSETTSGAFIFCMVIYLIISFLGVFVYETDREIITDKTTTQSIKVMSLTDNFTSEMGGSVRGALFFTYGQVQTDNKAYYRVMTGNDEIGYIMTDIPVENTRLFFVDGLPKMETDIKHIETCQKDGWFYGKFIKTKKTIEKSDDVVGYRLYLPKDSIKVDFTVDMK